MLLSAPQLNLDSSVGHTSTNTLFCVKARNMTLQTGGDNQAPVSTRAYHYLCFKRRSVAWRAGATGVDSRVGVETKADRECR